MPQCCGAGVAVRLIGRFTDCGVDMLLVTLSTTSSSYLLLTVYIFIFQISKSGGKMWKDWLKMPAQEYLAKELDQSSNGWDKMALLEILSDLGAEVHGEETNEIQSLTDSEALMLRHKLKGLYSFISQHPALLQRRLLMGSQKPSPPASPTHNIEKRSLELDIAQPACPSTSQWKLLYSARDINDTVVEVFQPRFGSEGQQWFYTVTCSNNAFKSKRACPGCCIGIDHTKIRFCDACMNRES